MKDIDRLYRVHLGELDKNRPKRSRQSIYEKIDNDLKYYGFKDIKRIVFESTRQMTGKAYVSLLKTYSDHMALDDEISIPFYEAIEKSIKDHGNSIELLDVVDLHLARK